MARQSTEEHKIAQMTGEETAALLEAFQRMGYYNPDVEALKGGLQDVSLRTYPEGQLLMREGEPATGFYIIQSGTAEVTRGKTKVATLGEYEVLGEMALVEDRPRSSTVTVKERSRIFRLSRRDFDFLMGSCEVFHQVIDALVADRRRFNDQLQGG